MEEHVNNKKFGAVLFALLLLGSAATAEIALKDVGGGKVEITFKFQDKATEMGVIGSFDNWTVPGEAMTQNEVGVWEKTITALATDEIMYKFYSKGNWIYDEKAPDSKDDGYGGKNGLIVVSDILSGVTPQVPGAAPVVVAKGVVAKNVRPKAAFSTTTSIESDTRYTSAALNLADPVKSVVNAKSEWSFKGDLIPYLPGYIDLTVFNGQQKVLDKATPLVASSVVPFETGVQKLASGLLFTPFFYLDGNGRPTIDKFQFGFDTPVLNYQTGYQNAYLPGHTSVLWDTVGTDFQKANNGYSAFKLGKALQNWGPLTVNASVVPNVSQSGFFGLYSVVSAELPGLKAEFQYDMKAFNKTDPAKYFDNMARQDYIAGVEAYAEGFEVHLQGLMAKYLAGGTTDLKPANEKIAYKAVVGYKDYEGTLSALLGYAYRGGLAAQLLYGDSNTVLGAAATQTASLTYAQQFDYVLSANLEASAVLAVSDPATNNVAVTVRPGMVINFEKIPSIPLSFEVFAKGVVNTKPATSADKLTLPSAGAKFAFGVMLPGVIDAATVFYGYDAAVAAKPFHTLLGDLKLGKDLVLQAGVGLRTAAGAANPLGFSAGLAYTMPAPELKTPTLYAHFADNMDPYNGAGTAAYALADFGTAAGVAGLDGSAALQAGIAWSF